MKRLEFKKHLKKVAPSGEFEALVSVRCGESRSRFHADRQKYYEEKNNQVRHVAECIQKVLGSDEKVDIFEDIGQIVVSASSEHWLLVLNRLEKLEKSRSFKTEIYPNAKIGLMS